MQQAARRPGRKNTLASGRKFRTANLKDDCTRECPAILVDFSLPGHRVTLMRDDVARERGYEDAAASVREIERCAGDPDFAQVLILARTAEPLGQRRYWPILEAAAAHGLPVAVHVFGYGGHALSGAGWPSYYIEEMTGHSAACQAAVASLVLEGAFARFPELKVIIIEGGFGWLPALTWRLDNHWSRARVDLPEVPRPPSEYLEEQLWITTQPMEEPADPRHLLETMGWIGFDRLLFATDYPHWDFDDPVRALPKGLTPEQRRQIQAENARRLYRLG